MSAKNSKCRSRLYFKEMMNSVRDCIGMKGAAYTFFADRGEISFKGDNLVSASN